MSLNPFNQENNERELTPTDNMAWAIESALLDIYLLLIHRIEGLTLSLDDFWNMDIWTLSKLYTFELELIDNEPDIDGKPKRKDPSLDNDPEMDALVMEMGIDV